MYGHTLVMITVFAAIAAHSQSSNIYQNLDFSTSTTGLFGIRFPDIASHPMARNILFLTFEESGKLLNSMNRAAIDPANPVVPNVLVLGSAMNEAEQVEGVIPISIMEMKFEYVSQSSIDNNFIFIQNEQIFQRPQTNVFAKCDAAH